MKTHFAAALSLCGLTQQEAADFLDCSLGAVKHWSRGRRNPSPGIWKELAALHKRQLAAGEAALDTCRDLQESTDGTPGALTFTSNPEWPSDGARLVIEASVILQSGIFPTGRRKALDSGEDKG